jgi:hypothetical protein
MEFPELEQNFQALLGGQAAVIGQVGFLGFFKGTKLRNAHVHIYYFIAAGVQTLWPVASGFSPA